MKKLIGSTLKYQTAPLPGEGVIKEVWLDDDGSITYEIQEDGALITSFIFEKEVVEIR